MSTKAKTDIVKIENRLRYKRKASTSFRSVRPLHQHLSRQYPKGTLLDGLFSTLKDYVTLPFYESGEHLKDPHRTFAGLCRPRRRTEKGTGARGTPDTATIRRLPPSLRRKDTRNESLRQAPATCLLACLQDCNCSPLWSWRRGCGPIDGSGTGHLTPFPPSGTTDGSVETVTPDRVHTRGRRDPTHVHPTTADTPTRTANALEFVRLGFDG